MKYNIAEKPEGSATPKKKVNTPLRISMEGMSDVILTGNWKKAIKQAKNLAGRISEDNVGKYVHVYEHGNNTPVWTARMIYGKNDPVWSVIPDEDQCKDLFCAVIERALFDALIIKLPEHGKQWQPSAPRTIYTAHSIQKAKNYVMRSRDFTLICDMAGINANAVREAARGKE